MLDLRLLETFREVATRGSFSAAADALNFTQPAVSQHVARLEKQLGTKLFERDARGVTLTRSGDELLRHAEALLGAARRAETEVRAAAGVEAPTVRIAAFPSAASAFVPLALRELRSAEPSLQPDLHVLEPEEAVDALARGKLDVALTLDSDLLAGPTKPGIDAVLVHDDPMLVALPTDHRLAREATIDLGELRHEEWLMPCVGGTCPDSNIVLRACADAGFEPVVHFESGDYAALTGLAASGLGVALIPSLAAVSSRTDVVIRPVRGTAPTRRVLASYRAPGGDPAVEAVIDALRLAGRRLALQSQTHAIAA